MIFRPINKPIGRYVKDANLTLRVRTWGFPSG
jgi:hypothetical protein